MSGWRRASEKGDDGVELAAAFYRHLGIHVTWTTEGVIAAELDHRLGADGVFMVDGQTWCVDAKLCTRARETKNAFIETWSNRSLGRKGWLWGDVAWRKEIAYVIGGTNCMLRISPLSQLQRFVDQHGHLYREVEQREHAQTNDTWGRLIPIVELRDRGLATVVQLPAKGVA